MRKSSKRSFATRFALACATAGAAAAMTLGAASANDETLQLVTTIDVGGKGLGAFDISFVDPRIGLYVLADRTNAGVDFVDAHSAQFLYRVGGFAGVVLNPDGTPNNAKSGPDGVVIVRSSEVWAGDGDSTMKVIDIASQQITHVISTGGQLRVDEMAWDPADHIVAAANNADTPPFVSFLSTDTYEVVGKIVFDGSNGTPNATDTGIEQPAWSPLTGLIYVSVPQTDPKDPTTGGVAIIDPKAQQVIGFINTPFCSPAGLTIGPRREAMVGCSAKYGSPPNVFNQSTVIDYVDRTIAATILQVGGSDQVWYDRGSSHYYLAARNNVDNNNKPMPVLGVVDARGNVYDGGEPSSISAHSVAANSNNLYVFLPIGFVAAGASDPTNPCPTTGCIAVYQPTNLDRDDMAFNKH